MAKLPTRDDLSGSASLRSGRAIASADTSAIGRGLQSFGRSVTQTADDIVQQQNAVDLARAEAFKTKQLMSAENDFAYDPDYSTVGARASQRTGQIVGDAASLIRDPQMRQRWQIGAGTDAARVNDSIGDRGIVLKRQAETVAFDEALEANRRLYVDPATPEAVRQKARADIQGAIEMGAGSGLLTPGDADVRTTKYLEDADYDLGKLAVEQGGFTPNTTLAAADLPPEAAALLGTIAGTESPDYNTLNGGEKFSGYADHPGRVGVGGTTTAAGRYQFVKGTWDRAKAALGLTDFSPASQDRAAWWLAQEDYKSRTGRNLQADLQSKDPATIAGVRRNLTSTWDGLNSLSDDAFNGKLAAGPVGNPDWYTRLSPEQRSIINNQVTTRQNQNAVASRGVIEVATTNAPAAIQNTGTYDGALPDLGQFAAAYGPQEGAQRFAQFQAAVDTSHQAYDMRTMSTDDIAAVVASAVPTSSGADAALEQAKYEALTKAADQTIKARNADPSAYAQQAFPDVKAAWANVQQSGGYQAALAATAAAQQQLGIENMKLLPDALAADATKKFNDTSFPEADRVASISQLVLATPDPAQRRAVFDQLVASGLPAMTEGAVNALERGDTGAAQRLFQAAMVDPSKLPGQTAEKPADIKAAVQSRLMDQGAVGDIYYGLTNGDALNIQRAQRDEPLITNAVMMRLRSGEGLDAAIDAVGKDLFGDVVPISEGNISVLVPNGTDGQAVARGLNGLLPTVRTAVEAQASLELSPAPSGTPLGLSEAGNIDLAARPVVRNANGTVSTVRSMSFEENGQEILVPTVSPAGRILSDDEAIDLYHQTGQHLGKFDNPDHATAYAESLHEAQAAFYGAPDRASGLRSVFEAAGANHADNVLSQGYFRNAGDGYAFIDPYTGDAVTGTDGAPLIFTDDQVLAGNADPTVNPGASIDVDAAQDQWSQSNRMLDQVINGGGQ